MQLIHHLIMSDAAWWLKMEQQFCKIEDGTAARLKMKRWNCRSAAILLSKLLQHFRKNCRKIFNRTAERYPMELPQDFRRDYCMVSDRIAARLLMELPKDSDGTAARFSTELLQDSRWNSGKAGIKTDARLQIKNHTRGPIIQNYTQNLCQTNTVFVLLFLG